MAGFCPTPIGLLNVCYLSPVGPALDATHRREAFEQLSTHLSETLGAAVTSQDWTLDFKGKGFSGTVTLSDCHVSVKFSSG